MPIELQDTGVSERQLLEMLVEAKNHPSRRKFLEDRERYWRLYMGEVLLPEHLKASAKKLEIKSKENVIFQGIETITAVLSKNNPFFYCVPRNPQLPNAETLAQEMNNFLRYDYEITHMPLVLQEWIRASRITGASVVKVLWDTSRREDFNEGVNRVEVISWDDFLPYPYAPSIEQAPYLIHRTRRTYNDIVHDPRYGEKAKEALGARGLRGRLKDGWDKIIEVIAISDVTAQGRELHDVYEYWIRPYAFIEMELDDGKKVKRSKYPNGIIITVINGRAVYCRENKFKHKRFPFEMLYCYRHRDRADKPELRGTIYDFMGEVEQAESPQMDMDMCTLLILANSRVTASPPLVVDASMLSVDIDSHEFRASEIIKVNGDVNSVKWMQPGMISPQIFQLLEQKRQAVLDAMGVTDYMMGTAPKGLSHTSGFAVVSAQEAGFGRTNPKINLLDISIQGLGKLLLANNQQFRKEESYYAFTEYGQRIAQAWTEDHSNTPFTIQVEHGSTTPVNDIDKVANTAQLYNMLLPLMSAEVVPPQALDLADWAVRTMKLPGSQEVSQLIQEVKQGSIQANELMTQLQQQMQTEGLSPASPEQAEVVAQ